MMCSCWFLKVPVERERQEYFGTLEFIEAWPITRLSLLARTMSNIEPIYRLPSLATVKLTAGSKAVLDVRRISSLKSLSAEWGSVRDSLSERPEIEDLYLGGYGEADLRSLRWNVALRRLRLKDRPRLQSLDGVEVLSCLEQLGVWSAPLEGIGALGELSGNRLSELQLESCGIRDIKPLCSLSGLRFLNLSDNGDVPSIRNLAGLTGLEVLWLFGTTRVVDGDLSVLAGLPLRELRMKSRKGYVPTVEDLHRMIEHR
jgi:Leucine-rich repeat (LRR) protein